MSEGQPNTPKPCPEPGCGLEMIERVWPSKEWFCPRNADAHALCKKVADLEATLAGAIQRGGELIGERDALTSANAALEEKLKEAAKPCEWTEDEDDGIWTATCGLVDWCFNEGGPIENKVHFCVGCGHPVVVKKGAEHGE